jgi:hypothetical protein
MHTIRYLPSRQISFATIALFAISACSDDESPAAPRRQLATITVSVGAPTIEIGELTAARATGLDAAGDSIETGAITWTSSAPDVAAVNTATGLIFGIAPGTAQISAQTPDGKVGEQLVTVSLAPAVSINEVKPDADAPNGWLELYNPTARMVDLSGWLMVDANFFGPEYRFPAGSVIPPGGYLVTEESSLPFGIEAFDTLHLFSRFGVQVDAVQWTSEPATSLGRCGSVATLVATTAATKGATNACP